MGMKDSAHTWANGACDALQQLQLRGLTPALVGVGHKVFQVNEGDGDRVEGELVVGAAGSRCLAPLFRFLHPTPAGGWKPAESEARLQTFESKQLDSIKQDAANDRGCLLVQDDLLVYAYSWLCMHALWSRVTLHFVFFRAVALHVPGCKECTHHTA